nr:MAG TPA: NACHT domain protein [Caudoviricetes sp.]
MYKPTQAGRIAGLRHRMEQPMADNSKFSPTALALLKANLGYYDTAIPKDLQTYLEQLLAYALEAFAGMGIALTPGTLEDDLDQMTYAAYLYRHGVTGAGKTEMLRQIIRDRKVRRATDGEATA